MALATFPCEHWLSMSTSSDLFVKRPLGSERCLVLVATIPPKILSSTTGSASGATLVGFIRSSLH